MYSCVCVCDDCMYSLVYVYVMTVCTLVYVYVMTVLENFWILLNLSHGLFSKPYKVYMCVHLCAFKSIASREI